MAIRSLDRDASDAALPHKRQRRRGLQAPQRRAVLALASHGTLAAPCRRVRVPWFRDPKGLGASLRRGAPPATPRVLVVIAPVGGDAAGVRRLARGLDALGVQIELAQECHGEVHGQAGVRLWPDRLLIEVRPADYDAVVFAGGRAASVLAEDPLARSIARAADAQGRPVAAWAEGALVLRRAGLKGLIGPEAATLVGPLSGRLGLPAVARFRSPGPRAPSPVEP